MITFASRLLNRPLTALLLVTLCLTAAAAVADEPGATGRVTVVWQDVHRLLNEDFEPMAREVESIFRAARVEVGWRIGGAAEALEGGPTEVQLVLLANRPGPPRPIERVMGECRSSQRAPRTAWVYLEGVARVLELPGPGPRSPVERAQLGRALARVAAHEIVHAIAGDLGHARSGLMGRSLGRQDLLLPHIRWDASFAEAVRLSLAPASAGRRADASVAHALTAGHRLSAAPQARSGSRQTGRDP